MDGADHHTDSGVGFPLWLVEYKTIMRKGER